MTERERRQKVRNTEHMLHRRKKYNDYSHDGIRDKIFSVFDARCALCGWCLDTNTTSRGCEIHHIIPVCEDGKNSFDNLICLCPNCHKTVHHFDSDMLRKRLLGLTKTEDEFDAKRLLVFERAADDIEQLLRKEN